MFPLFMWVSILVLMDVTLQPGWSPSTLIEVWGFNPCFNGCHSSTFHIYKKSTKENYVSILVLMDVTLQQGE